MAELTAKGRRLGAGLFVCATNARDPFDASQLIQYRVKDRSYVLYSNGPDDVEDGGKAAVDPEYSDRARYLATLDCKGHIVAGVNIY